MTISHSAPEPSRLTLLSASLHFLSGQLSKSDEETDKARQTLIRCFSDLSGQLFSQNPNKRPEVLATAEGSPEDDDSYLGYSVAAGNFDGPGEGGVAVGMPRGAGLLGKVSTRAMDDNLMFLLINNGLWMRPTRFSCGTVDEIC